MRGRAIEGAVRIVSVGHLGLRLVRHRPSHGLVSLPSTVRSQMVFRASGECGPASDPSGTPGLGPATIARIEWVGSAGANSRAMLDSDIALSTTRGRPNRVRWTNRTRRSADGSTGPLASCYRTLAPCGDQRDIRFPLLWV